MKWLYLFGGSAKYFLEIIESSAIKHKKITKVVLLLLWPLLFMILLTVSIWVYKRAMAREDYNYLHACIIAGEEAKNWTSEEDALESIKMCRNR